MSAAMLWRPVAPPDGRRVSDEVRHCLAKRLWNQDGSMSAEARALDGDIIPYLEGLRDAEVKGAQELIEAIRTHGTIEVWIER